MTSEVFRQFKHVGSCGKLPKSWRPAIRILFIGNSHTYANGLPYQVRELMALGVSDTACEVWMLAPGGRDLGWHAQEPQTRQAVAYHTWDVIVLQQATHPFAGFDELNRQYGKLAPFVETSGAGLLFYETWSRQVCPADQAVLSGAMGRLCADHGLRLVPVGSAWHAAMADGVEAGLLYQADGSHASAVGTYLGACVFYGVLTGRSPEGLPGRVTAGSDVLADVPPRLAARLQAIAWRTVNR